MSIGRVFDRSRTMTAYPNGVQHHYWLKARNWVVYDLLRRMERDGTVLDVGCGRGVTVEFLRSRGLECFGCDIAEGPAISADVEPFLHYRTSSLRLEPTLARRIRVVLLLDVLEHVTEPGELLVQHSVHFPNISHLVITLPAGPDIWSNYDEHYGHCARYTLESAGRLLDGTGFSSVETGYFFHLLYPPLKAMLTLGFHREVSVIPPRSRLNRALHGIFATWLRADAKLFPKGLRGTSLFMLCRKESDSISSYGGATG